MVCVACKDMAMVELLCGRGADISLTDGDGATALHYAAQLCSSPNAGSSSTATAEVPALRTLLGAGVDPDSRDNDGRTPIMWAATSGN